MWAFAIKQKMTAAILLCTVLGLVMLTNMREQRTADRIRKAVTSIYEDRLVVAQYILKLSKQIEGMITLMEKQNGEIIGRVDDRLTDVAKLNSLYEKTILTEIERTNFENFKMLCQDIFTNNRTGNHTEALQAAHKAEGILQTLSSIQVEEGKNQLDEVLSMTYFSNIFSYVELAILIVIAVMIQVLVFASKTMLASKKSPHESLN